MEAVAGRRFARAVADDPRMLGLWDAEANTVDPTTIGAGSSRRRSWSCPVAEDHQWQASPASISKSLDKGFTGCPCCAGRQLSVTNSFAARYPGGVSLWHPTANDDLTPDRVLGGSPAPIWWRCPAGPDHEWQASPLVIGKNALSRGNSGCPFCAGHRASVTNSITAYPQLAAEWHATRNVTSPDQVVAGTGKKLWWQCLDNPEHEWQATGANRVRGRGCPRCKKMLRSVLEVCLAHELQEFFPDLDLAEDKVVVDGAVRHVDLLLRGHGVVIEVDGRYRHSGPVELDRDRRKTQLLTEAGYRVLRVRERPLPPVTDHDATLPVDATVKQAADIVLTRLRDLGWAELPGLAEYMTEPEPRRLADAVAQLRAERPGKSIRLPGPAAFTRPRRWVERLAVLETYVEREGHANVPDAHVEDDFPLGKWVAARRAQRRRGRLAPEREAILEQLPGWTWDAVEARWEAGYQSLLSYLRREGHLDVPADHQEADGFPLGSWVRSHRRIGGRRTMAEEQRLRLETVPGWTYQLPTDAAWDAALAALTSFADREGHCATPRHHRESGINVDGWAKAQRARFHRGELAADRAGRLARVIGWSWTPQQDDWDRGYEILCAHVSSTGSAAVRRDSVRDGYPLGAWVGEQRQRHSSGALEVNRCARLESLPGWTWAPRADSWERHFDALLIFVAREGHARVPTDHVESGLPIASWVIRHRQEYKTGKLPADRVARLQALPGWTWDVLAVRWEEHYEALCRFASREGHARVPTTHTEDGRRLGHWVITLRRSYRTGNLAADRVQRLEKVPGWVWDARDAAWLDGHAHLERFQQRVGHCHVPRDWLEDGYRLGQWVSVQQGLLRRGVLRPDRVDRLASIAGWCVEGDRMLPTMVEGRA